MTPTDNDNSTTGPTTTRIQVEVGIPMFRLIPGGLGRLKRILDVEYVPKAGEAFALPIGLQAEVWFADDVNGHPRITINGTHLLNAMPAEQRTREGVTEIYEDLRAHGFSGITDWDDEPHPGDSADSADRT